MACCTEWQMLQVIFYTFEGRVKGQAPVTLKGRTVVPSCLKGWRMFAISCSCRLAVVVRKNKKGLWKFDVECNVTFFVGNGVLVGCSPSHRCYPEVMLKVREGIFEKEVWEAFELFRRWRRSPVISLWTINETLQNLFKNEFWMQKKSSKLIESVVGS